MNVTQIEIALSQKIDSNTSNLDLLTYSKALSYLKTNGIFTASNYGNLPSAASNEGKLYFIENIETVVWSNGTDWLKLLDKSQFQFQLWGWGGGTSGQLGDGTTTSKCSPIREFCSATDWCSVNVGDNHSTAIKTSGELWVWGINLCGRLGDGTETGKCSPVREFCSATDWCQVSAGHCHTAAIKTSGQLWAWGAGSCGRLGDGTTANSCSPVRERCSATDWCQVSVAWQQTAAIKTSGELWAWGANLCGRLGDGTVTTRCSPVREFCSATDWCQVSAGLNHTVSIKNDGTLWAWGGNGCGRLGDGTLTSRCSPVREFCSATDWCQVSANFSNRTVALKASGQIWSWGRNQCFNLGDGTTADRCSPVREICSATDWCQVSAGSQFTTAIKTSGQIWSWGINGFAATLGDGTTVTRCSPVREICSATDWFSVSAGGSTSFAIKIA